MAPIWMLPEKLSHTSCRRSLSETVAVNRLVETAATTFEIFPSSLGETAPTAGTNSLGETAPTADPVTSSLEVRRAI